MGRLKDRLDGNLVAWFVGTPMKDDSCLYCGKGYDRRAHCYIERVLPGVNVRPHTLHRLCFPSHKKRTEEDAKRQRKAVELAERTF
jgi:hypothetical protein